MKPEYELYSREILINDTKKRIDILKNACSNIRTLNGTIVLIDGIGLVIDLRKLVANWDYDNRPILNDCLIQYLNFDGYYFLDKEFKKINFKDLSDINLFRLYTYVEHIVPKSV